MPPFIWLLIPPMLLVSTTNAKEAITYNTGVSPHSDITKLQWAVDNEGFHLKITTKAQGWVGFGISPMGAMDGADIVYYETSKEKTLTDAWSSANAYPTPDTCNDWVLVDAYKKDGRLTVEMWRLLDTKDPQDHVIHTGDGAPTRVILAWGDSSSIGYHGTNRVSTMINIDDGILTPDPLVDVKAAVTAGTAYKLKFDHNNYEISTTAVQTSLTAPASEVYATTSIADGVTTYTEICVDVSSMPHSQIIGVEHDVTPETLQYVHHFVVKGYPDSACSGNSAQVYAWASGTMALAIPDEAGIPFGLNGFQSFRIQTHFDNPKQETGLLDSSGVSLYYVTGANLRANDAQMLIVGDPTVATNGETVPVGLSAWTFTCPASCLTKQMADAGVTSVTIFQRALHMHATGTYMESTITRDSTVLRKDKTEYYNWEFQGALRQPSTYTLEPGDSLTTKCVYDTAKTGMKMGPASDDEMCMDFIMIWPALNPYVWDGECGYSTSSTPDECESSSYTMTRPSDLESYRPFGTAPAAGKCVAVQEDQSDDEKEHDEKSEEGPGTIVAAVVGGVVLLVGSVAMWKFCRRGTAQNTGSGEQTAGTGSIEGPEVEVIDAQVVKSVESHGP